jgi:hypothetical protein
MYKQQQLKSNHQGMFRVSQTLANIAKKSLLIFDILLIDHLAHFINSLKNGYIEIGGI